MSPVDRSGLDNSLRRPMETVERSRVLKPDSDRFRYPFPTLGSVRLPERYPW